MRKQEISQNQLAERLNIPRSTFSQYINADPGHHPTSLILKLADYTGEDVGRVASYSLGREAQVNTQQVQRRVEALSYEEQIIADIVLLLYDNADDRALLESIAIILKHAHK